MGVLQELAAELGAEERTLRRAAAQGAMRCRRPGPRRLHLAPGERDYLRGHWHQLAELRSALRTKRRVRLAVVYGSVARGDEDAGSDLDLLVELDDPEPGAAARLALALEAVVGRRVDVALLERVEAPSPLLLEQILEEGRVLVDRDHTWPRLCARRRAISARARREYERQMREASAALEELSG